MRRFSFPITAITYFVIAFYISYHMFARGGEVNFLYDRSYLPALFSDIIVHGHAFSSWFLTPAPYFFPDMLVYFGINVSVENPFFSVILYAIFQNLLALFLISRIAYRVTKSNATLILVHIVFLVSFLFIFSVNSQAYLARIVSGFHFGTILNGLLAIYLLLRYRDMPTKSILTVFFIVIIASVASDVLFIIQFIVPFLLSFLILSTLRIKFVPSILPFVALIVLGCFFGFFIKCNVNSPWLDTEHIIADFDEFLTSFLTAFFLPLKKQFNKNLYLLIIIFSFYVYLFFEIFAQIKEYIFLPRRNLKMKEELLFLSLFVLFSSFCSIISNVLNFCIAERYLLNFFWFPALFFWLIPESRFNRKMILLLISSIIIINALVQNSSFVRAGYLPKAVQCIDEHVRNYNAVHKEKIKYGISGYWADKMVTLLSQEDIIVAQYKGNMFPRKIITSSERYRNSYDFAIVGNINASYALDLNQAFIEKINGKPEQIIACDGNVNLLIYGKGKLHAAKVEKP